MSISFFDSPALELDAGLVHFLFVCVCLAITVFRSSVQGFSPRTQFLLWISFLCNCGLRKLSPSYWWTWGLVVAQSCVLVLFTPNFRKFGVLGAEKSEKVLVLFTLIVSVSIGVVHHESLQSNKLGLPDYKQAYGLLGDATFETNSKQAMATANSESILRETPGAVAFLVGFKRALELLAMLPQYMVSCCQQDHLDFRVYAWVFIVGLYSTIMSGYYFGSLHVLSIMQALSFLMFATIAGSKVGIKIKDEEDETEKYSYGNGKMHAELQEINPLMDDGDGFLDLL